MLGSLCPQHEFVYQTPSPLLYAPCYALCADPNVADLNRGKTRQSASGVGAHNLGQDEAYLTVREILFRARSSRQKRDYGASEAILACFDLHL